MSLLLPGGLWENGDVLREVRLKPMTGLIERALADAAAAAGSVPSFVSAAIAIAVDTLGSEPVTRERAARLSVGDRQFLMLRLAALWLGDETWLSARCEKCSVEFDFSIRRTQVPVKPAGNGYPFVSARLAGQLARLRVPIGEDQENLVGVATESVREQLAQACCIEGAPERWDAPALAVAEAALEEVSPEVATSVACSCPECGFEQSVGLDPCAVGSGAGSDLDDEVHGIAMSYHWSEAEILSLPRERRQAYLRRIDHAKGYRA